MIHVKDSDVIIVLAERSNFIVSKPTAVWLWKMTVAENGYIRNGDLNIFKDRCLPIIGVTVDDIIIIKQYLKRYFVRLFNGGLCG